MQIFDLTHPMEAAMDVYPGDPLFACRPAATVEKDGFSVTAMSMGSHTGTHIDAPSHFFASGKPVDALPLAELVGPVVVLRADLGDASARAGLGDRERITWDDLVHRRDPASFQKLENAKGAARIVFVRTGWAAHWKTARYRAHPFLERRVATELLARGVRVLGVDTLSPDATAGEDGDCEGASDFGVHEEILKGGGMIVENLRGLDVLPEEPLIASLLPLRIEGCDGSPIRAVAWRMEE